MVDHHRRNQEDNHPDWTPEPRQCKVRAAVTARGRQHKGTIRERLNSLRIPPLHHGTTLTGRSL